jgi:glycosyltransferase involved in cell wall biosynthesis
MKLLYVTDNGFCNESGVFYYSAPNVAHIDNLSRFFDEFVVVARDDKKEHGYHSIPTNIKVHLVGGNNILKLKKIITREIESCDAVICYGINGYFASTIGRTKGTVVISYNGGDPYDFCISRGNLKGRILAPIAKYMCKKSFLNSDFGHYCDDFLFDRYPAKGEMLACSGVDVVCDLEVLNKRINKINRFNKLGIIRLGLIGHTKNSLKGIDIAIKAISKLDKNFYLEIVGRGATTEYIRLAKEYGCEDRIKFLGALSPGDELLSWLDSVDVYIQPSRIEGLPRATIEAMSRACPAVTSNVGALTKLIDERYVFDIKHQEELPKLINNIISYINLKEQAKQNFNTAKDYERIVRDIKYKKFYSKVVDAINKRTNNYGK